VVPFGVVDPSPRVVQAPQVRVTRDPGLVVHTPLVPISGEVEDDHAVDAILVYAGQDKVYYAPGVGTLTPWSVDLRLREGRNAIQIVAIDRDGLEVVMERVVWYVPDAGGP
jgi:hypothetical protein